MTVPEDITVHQHTIKEVDMLTAEERVEAIFERVFAAQEEAGFLEMVEAAIDEELPLGLLVRAYLNGYVSAKELRELVRRMQPTVPDRVQLYFTTEGRDPVDALCESMFGPSYRSWIYPDWYTDYLLCKRFATGDPIAYLPHAVVGFGQALESPHLRGLSTVLMCLPLDVSLAALEEHMSQEDVIALMMPHVVYAKHASSYQFARNEQLERQPWRAFSTAPLGDYDRYGDPDRATLLETVLYVLIHLRSRRPIDVHGSALWVRAQRHRGYVVRWMADDRTHLRFPSTFTISVEFVADNQVADAPTLHMLRLRTR